MATPDLALLSEQVALLDGRDDPFWGSRLSDDDAVAGLGETFVVNGLATTTRSAAARLIAPAQVEAVASWLSGMLPRADDGLYRESAYARPEPPVLRVPALGQRVGVALDRLPSPYDRWRLTVELYVLSGRCLYLVGGELAVRYKVLSETETRTAYSRSMLPFLPDGEEPTGAMLFIVGVPGRTAALGGLRGFRRGLLDAGQALAAMESLAPPGPDRWWWETEFFDDACGRVLGVDGVERVPLAVGVRLARSDSGEAG